MKRINSTEVHSSGVFAARFIVAFVTVSALGATSEWTGASGLLPSQLVPPWELWDTASPENPTLNAGILTLSTSAGSENMSYEQSGSLLQMPDMLVIEARVKLLASSASLPGRAGAAITFTTLPYVGGYFNISRDRIFLNDADSPNGSVEGPSASVPTTDAFHTYRIECTGLVAGSPIRVYRDGVLTLSGQTYFGDTDFDANPRILWGDFTSFGSGTSEWQSFQHNALAVEPEPRDDLHPRIAVSCVNICWSGRTNKTYQVQYQSELTGSVWLNLGVPVVGNGTNCFTATVDGGQHRFYRIVEAE